MRANTSKVNAEGRWELQAGNLTLLLNALSRGCYRRCAMQLVFALLWSRTIILSVMLSTSTICWRCQLAHYFSSQVLAAFREKAEI
ncbi:hypothetical protein H6F61_02310 [Cyanobacteria bacterium FACHB-472]|nr:hypothetical protein [Cyanobacteria bacterium FACHB-472]